MYSAIKSAGVAAGSIHEIALEKLLGISDNAEFSSMHPGEAAAIEQAVFLIVLNLDFEELFYLLV